MVITYPRNDLFDLGFDLDLFDIEVTYDGTPEPITTPNPGGKDTTAPVLESLELSNNTVDVSEGDRNLTLVQFSLRRMNLITYRYHGKVQMMNL